MLVPMRTARLGLAACLVAALLSPLGAVASADPDDTPDDTPGSAPSAPGRMLLVLDSSGSMKEPAAGGQTKIAAAKTALRQVIDKLPEDQEVGLRVYGAKVFSRQDAGACTDSQLVVPVGSDNRAELTEALAGYTPYGETPIGHALAEAGKDLGSEGQRSIVLVSDGEPTCDPDPCAVARELSQDGIDLRIDVVGLHVSGAARSKLQCIADAGNGTYYDAADADELAATLVTSTVRASRPFDLTGLPVKGAAAAAEAPIIETGQYLDTIPLNDGLWYRIKRTAPGSTIHVGITHRSSASGNFGEKMIVKVSVEPERLQCNSAMSFPLGSLGYAGASSWKADPQEECNVSDEVYVHAEAISGETTLVGQPVEVSVYEEPPLADVSGRDLAPLPEEPAWTTLVPGTPVTDVVPGTSISNAPVVSDGTYAFDINPGETQVVAVPVDWGQDLQAQFDAPLSKALLTGTDTVLGGPELQILGSVRDRGSVDFFGNKPADWTTGGWNKYLLNRTTTYRTGAQTLRTTYLNRDQVDGASLAGLRYVQVTYFGDDQPAMTYTLTLKTNGTAGAGAPAYADVEGLTPPAADSALAVAAEDDEESEAADPGSASGGSSDEGDVPWLPVGLGAGVLLAALAGLALAVRRRGRAA